MGDIQVFKHGSRWVRADFHLHTQSDKEFDNSNDNDFGTEYLAKLEEQNISIGIITNHNKFIKDEFKYLRREAKKKEIFLLPGVELSVKDGSNGIHTLIVFSDQWIYNKENKDYVNDFLTVTFQGQANIENKNSKTNHDIDSTIKLLEKYNRDYFLIFAHVEEDNGLWGGLNGDRIKQYAADELFRLKTLGFQKVRTRDERTKIKQHLGKWYPAEVEGSDPKSVDEVGKGNSTYLKIGAFTFEAVKYALLDYENRVSDTPKDHPNSWIQSVSFDGGILDEKTIHLSPELNSLIGIRGSGKSAILEAIRYALNIPFGEKSLDLDYKKNLISHALGSGGKVIVKAIDRRGQSYEVRRILNEQPDVFIDNTLQPGVSILETIVHKPIYFGQKDLSSTGEGFEKDLVEKLVGNKLVDIRQKIEEQRMKVVEVIDRLNKLSDAKDKKQEFEDKKKDASYRLKFYREHGVEEKLNKQVNYDSDSRKLHQTISFTQSYLSDLEDFINQFEDDLNNQKSYTSKNNQEFFEEFFASYSQLIKSFDSIKNILTTGRDTLKDLQERSTNFDKLKAGLKEEFAEIERKLAEELKASGIQSIKPAEFRELTKVIDHANQMIDALDKQEKIKEQLSKDLLTELSTLNGLWHDEYKLILSELKDVNENQVALKIKVEYKNDKTSYLEFMKDMFRGSRIRENTFQRIVKDYQDFIVVFKDHLEVSDILGGSANVFWEYFWNNASSLLTWQVPNRFIIEYREKELKDHSLGQRASALILFVLSQQENDVIIIDQPEDDLDNQTIYEDVIKLICQLKPKTQFLFATHNANFPVLGDSEQIHSCSYSNDQVTLQSGSIDDPVLQQEIVDIMEGGEEAFKRRKEIYQIWKPRNS